MISDGLDSTNPLLTRPKVKLLPVTVLKSVKYPGVVAELEATRPETAATIAPDLMLNSMIVEIRSKGRAKQESIS